MEPDGEFILCGLFNVALAEGEIDYASESLTDSKQRSNGHNVTQPFR